MELHHLLSGHPWETSILHFDRVTSTNLMLQEMARQGAPEGTVIFADSQSSGMGRLGRSFHSPAGAGIYMSVLLRPGCNPQELMHLTCAVAVAVHKAIENVIGVQVGIKWVNDLIYNDRKLAGILTKLSVDPGTGLVDWAIVGIGINCSPAAFPPELDSIVTCLERVVDGPVDRTKLAAELVRQLEQMCRTLFTAKAETMAHYRKSCAVIGEKVWLIRGDERTSAAVLDVDNDGGLVVQGDNAMVWTVNSGEITLRKQNSAV